LQAFFFFLVEYRPSLLGSATALQGASPGSVRPNRLRAPARRAALAELRLSSDYLHLVFSRVGGARPLPKWVSSSFSMRVLAAIFALPGFQRDFRLSTAPFSHFLAAPGLPS